MQTPNAAQPTCAAVVMAVHSQARNAEVTAAVPAAAGMLGTHSAER